ncbi:MAG TPA: tyrosine-type recombinase/integrase [Candidatus Sulfotelmatobacter sp.]|nr:tyrosine-type recombinase/integrase [Candidatus Sulfotelmatobacter sp.]
MPSCAQLRGWSSKVKQESYVHWLRHDMGAIQTMPAGWTSEKKLERFLTQLAVQRQVAASTQNQAFNAILFFYKEVLGKPLQNVQALRATRPAHLRHAPTVSETRALLLAVRDRGGYPTSLVSHLLYGCGLRVSEPLNLRIKDVNLEQARLVIRGAKGGKDRVVSLPPSLKAEMERQRSRAYSVWQEDRKNAIPVALPNQLARKYPEYQSAWPWAWLFPAQQPCRHPRTRQIVRYRMHEANVQGAIRAARRKLGIMVLPHELRHAYATHCLEGGINPRAIQEAMGHSSLETTMGYLHAESLSVHSPLETLLPGSPAAQATETGPSGTHWTG